jgi:hypothetical protein
MSFSLIGPELVAEDAVADAAPVVEVVEVSPIALFEPPEARTDI